MLPANVQFLESVAQELRDLSEREREAYSAVVGALLSLGREGPPEGTRRYPIVLPSGGKTVELMLFGFEISGRRILFEGERVVTRTTEGWNLVRGMPRAGEGMVYTVWAIVKLGTFSTPKPYT